MKPPIFVDTGYILALVNTGDQYHPLARQTVTQIEPPHHRSSIDGDR